MRSFNVIKSGAKESPVLEFEPKAVDAAMTDYILQFVDAEKQGQTSDFKMSDLVRIQTGVAELEQKTIAEQVEVIVLERLKSVQEKAYREGYELGREEGRVEALKKHEKDILDKVASLQQLTSSILNLKPDLVSFNEAHLVKLAYFFASLIAMEEIAANPERVLSVIRKSIELAQADEEVTFKVSMKDLQFLEEIKSGNKKEYEFLNRVKFEASEAITPGGVVLETNYGVVDASLEERTKKLWKMLNEVAPKVKNKLGAA